MSARIALVYLTGPFAPGGKDWDRGEFVRHDAAGLTLRGNGSGDTGVRTYPQNVIQRVEHRDNWS